MWATCIIQWLEEALRTAIAWRLYAAASASASTARAGHDGLMRLMRVGRPWELRPRNACLMDHRAVSLVAGVACLMYRRAVFSAPGAVLRARVLHVSSSCVTPLRHETRA